MHEIPHPFNKREFERIPETVPIEITRLVYPLPQTPDTVGTGKNISAGGVCFTTSVWYPPKTMLSLQIALTGWQDFKKPHSLLTDATRSVPLTGIAEVAWSRRAEDAAGYEIGVRFIDIYEDDYRALITYLQRAAKETP